MDKCIDKHENVRNNPCENIVLRGKVKGRNMSESIEQSEFS